VRQSFEALQRLDLHPQFPDRPRGRGLVENLLFGRFDFGVWCILQIIDVFLVESRDVSRNSGAGLGAPLQDFELA